MRSLRLTRPLSFLLWLPACGGSPATPPGVPTAPHPGSAPATAVGAKESTPAPVDVWRGVLHGGATYTLRGGEGGVLTVAATDARVLGAGAVVRLRWRFEGAEYTQAPSQVAADPSAIHLLDASLEDEDVKDALDAPSPWPRLSSGVAPMSRLDGLYAQVWRGPEDVVVCYGEGPPPDAPPCEDVCFAEMCISQHAGVVELSGTWAPNSEAYVAAGFEKFRETLKFDEASPAPGPGH